jgi:hypothetical protein
VQIFGTDIDRDAIDHVRAGACTLSSVTIFGQVTICFGQIIRVGGGEPFRGNSRTTMASQTLGVASMPRDIHYRRRSVGMVCVFLDFQLLNGTICHFLNLLISVIGSVFPCHRRNGPRN